MVSAPVSFSLAELKAISSQSQITMHTCMQGWTGIAKWTGIRVRDLLEQVGQIDPEAGWVMFESFGMAQHMQDGRPVEPYYTCCLWTWPSRMTRSWPGTAMTSRCRACSALRCACAARRATGTR